MTTKYDCELKPPNAHSAEASNMSRGEKVWLGISVAGFVTLLIVAVCMYEMGMVSNEFRYL